MIANVEDWCDTTAACSPFTMEGVLRPRPCRAGRRDLKQRMRCSSGARLPRAIHGPERSFVRKSRNSASAPARPSPARASSPSPGAAGKRRRLCRLPGRADQPSMDVLADAQDILGNSACISRRPPRVPRPPCSPPRYLPDPRRPLSSPPSAPMSRPMRWPASRPAAIC